MLWPEKVESGDLTDPIQDGIIGRDFGRLPCRPGKEETKMNLVMSGLDWNRAPIELRERLSFGSCLLLALRERLSFPGWLALGWALPLVCGIHLKRIVKK